MFSLKMQIQGDRDNDWEKLLWTVTINSIIPIFKMINVLCDT